MSARKRPPSSSGRKPRRAPIENPRRNPLNPRRAVHRRRSADELSEFDLQARHHPADCGAPASCKAIILKLLLRERRWRAAQRAGLHDVPVAVIEANDAQSLEYAIIENVQRAYLNPIEEASGYLALMGMIST